MKLLKTALAAAALIAPMLIFDAPAQALTARQYHAQGHGRYITSKGRAYGHSRMYRHRHHGWRHHHWRHHRMRHHPMM